MLLQGSTYKMPIQIEDPLGTIITSEMVTKGQFVIGDYEKFYPEEVTYDKRLQCFIVPLSEEETFNLKKGKEEWQIRLLFVDGTVDGSIVKYEDVKRSLIKTVLGGA